MFVERIAELHSQVHSLKMRVAQLERSVQVTEGENSSLQSQLEAKTSSLDEAISELERNRRMKTSEETEGEKRQKKIDELNVEVSSNNSSVLRHFHILSMTVVKYFA